VRTGEPSAWRGGTEAGGLDWPRRTQLVAAAQALLVTLLWSSSFVLIKLGLRDPNLSPLSFAGLRYTLAALVLLPIAWRQLRTVKGWAVDRRLLGQLVGLGLLFYTTTQGAQFVALALLPAVALSLVLTATPVLVALIGWRTLGERPSRFQLLGISALLLGALLYFGPIDLGPTGELGLLVALIGLLANAASAVLGRALAQQAAARLGGVVALTALSMGLGGLALLAAGLLLEGPPRLDLPAWLIVAWLALVNTAFAFTLWNHTLKVLTAVESSVLNNTMLAQIALLAWLFLDEPIDARQLAGLALATAGVLLVQLTARRATRNSGRQE
jgi:drug/metabolite transporter (DMT)-like permease